MILQKKLAALLFKQSWNNEPIADIVFEELPQGIQDRYLKQADEIIELFTEAIRKLEFKTSSFVPDGN